MSYAGVYDPTPVPEPKKKPEIKVVLACGETAWAGAWWMSDPLYGGWRPLGFARCFTHGKTESVKCETWPPERRTR